MEITFITIHDLSKEARILYSSDSIVDVLGHTPDEVVGQSTWTFFNSTDLEGAKQVHDRSILMDKASVLVYCDIQNREGVLIRCECCFSIVYNVLVACTSIYREGPLGAKRRIDAPYARRMFSSSPEDPRYHMLQHLSARFRQDANQQSNEPRAALFLNRFTRTLTIMYATSGIDEIIGISSEDMKGRSFYHCIAENCLSEAVECLETAKGNDSVAYMRFRFRNPRQDDEPVESLDEVSSVSFSDGVSDTDMTDEPTSAVASFDVTGDNRPRSTDRIEAMSSGHGTPASDSTSALELEAIVSCTSDGMVVCLRRARTAVPRSIHNTVLPSAPIVQPNTSYFAAPWGVPTLYQPFAPVGFGPTTYPGMPMMHGGPPIVSVTPSTNEASDQSAFLRAIQECGVFAWDLVGINGTFADVARGHPAGRAAPPDGPAIWAPEIAFAASMAAQGTLPTPEQEMSF